MKFELLKNKNYVLLLLGQMISGIGSKMQSFALALYVLKITGSASRFASILALSFVPELIIGPVSGVITDWVDRKNLIILLDISSSLLTGIFAALYLMNNNLNVFSISVLVILLSVISTVFQPAATAIMPGIVNKEKLPDANSLWAAASSGVLFSAPVIAGALLQYFSLFFILLINSISFLLSGLSEVFIDVPKNNNMPKKISIKIFCFDFTEGIKFIINNKLILSICILLMSVNFLISPIITIGQPYILKNIFNASDIQYGIFQSGLSVPMFIAPILFNSSSKKHDLKSIIIKSLGISSIIVLCLGFVSNSLFANFTKGSIPIILLFILFFTMTVFDLIANLAICTVEQESVPSNMLGRIESTMMSLAFALYPLGQIIFGLLFDSFPAWICILTGGLLNITSIFICRKLIKNF
ncbi:MAG: MFS transporter [Bacillota bacterium]|nr:MFS transporter [Bacillota bacterium]